VGPTSPASELDFIVRHPTFSPRLQNFAHFGKQRVAELVLLQLPAKLQQRRGIGHAFAIQVISIKRRSAVLSSNDSSHAWFARLTSTAPSKGAASAPDPPADSVAGLRGVRLDHSAQLRPRNDLVNRLQEHVALGRAVVLLEALIGR